MNPIRFACCDELRRNALVGHPTLNAIDYLEVADLKVAELDSRQQAEFASLPSPDRNQLLWQRRLTIHFVNPLLAAHVAGLSSTTIRIEGGERIRDIRVDLLGAGAVAGTTSVSVRASEAGDFSRYLLRLVRSNTDLRPPPGFDPILSRIDFSFKVDCPSEFDCRTGHICLRAPDDEPEIDYLAKDYASFRRLILDRLSLLVPDWRERSPADLGVALVELLAYVGDHLSYEQDAIGTEAYLETARRRTSVRRHAVLVDYPMHDGCNARAWLHVEVANDTLVAPSNLRCCTTVDGLPRVIAPAGPDESTALAEATAWFEPVVTDPDPDAIPPSIALFADHHELTFYPWGDDRCCLPRGSTSATLRGHHPALAVGMVLVFEEVVGPGTGDPADADPTHRHAVRLTEVTGTEDGAPLVDPLDGTPITTIAWSRADALPFPLCISARTDDGRAIADVSVARGNMVLVDHGLTIADEDLGTVPPVRLSLPSVAGSDGCDADDACADDRDPVPVRYRPVLASGPLTGAMTVRVRIETGAGTDTIRLRVDESAPAAGVYRDADPGALRDVRPAIRLTSTLAGTSLGWSPVRDLLDSADDATDFVAEIEADGTTTLRFGDDEHGRRPRMDERFVASYRVGNGRAGNVGAGAITHVVTNDARVVAVSNPMPARGGLDPETVEQVRRRAPEAFKTQERAVTPADYEAVTTRHQDIQRAAASLRWTGSWHTVFVTVDRLDGERLDDAFETELTGHVERYRMAGHDLEFDDPRFVPLEIGLEVCVDPGYFRSDVKQRLLEILSNRTLADGRRGLFHPDTFTFGQTIYLSPILAAARDVPGVDSANVVTFQRQFVPERVSRDEGRLTLGRLEVARLDNDPDFPERGVLRLQIDGGK